MINATEDRGRELARLILQVRNTAVKVVLYHVTNGLTDEVRKLHFECKNAQNLLNIEGEVDGGKIKEIVCGFTAFVGIHVARLPGWNGQILEGDKNTMQQIEIDESRFCGRMADRADEAILNIQKTFKR